MGFAFRSTHPAAATAANRLLRPVRHRLAAHDDRPTVRSARLHAIAVLLGALPGRAEAILGELPGAFALAAGLADRLARHLVVRRKHHLELDVGRRRRSERLAVEEQRLDLLRRESSGRRGEQKSGADKKRNRGTHDPYAYTHRCPP